MKKEKIITRTIESTHVCYKVYDLIQKDVFDLDATFSGNLSEKDCTKRLSEFYSDNTDVRFIMVDSVDVCSKLYGLPESVFMMYAEELPPRKAYEKEED